MKILSLNLEREIPEPVSVGFWGFLDACLIGLFFALFGSKFIITPGLIVDLPRLESTRVVAVAPEYDVLTVGEVEGEEMILFEGRILTLDKFESFLEKRGVIDSRATLLLRVDAYVSMQTLASLVEAASDAGYNRIQIATEEGQEQMGEATLLGEPDY